MSATIAMGMMCQLIVGTVRNNRNPVNLLAIVWGTQNRLMMSKDNIWLTILMMTMIPAQIHSHEGIDIVGSNWMAQQATNNKSAMLSRTDPVLLSAWSFLANQPSTMSLRPQRTYSVQNCHPAALQNRRSIEPAILSAVMMFGKCFKSGRSELNVYDYSRYLTSIPWDLAYAISLRVLSPM